MPYIIMSLLTTISGKFSRNSLRGASLRLNIALTPPPALNHSKAEAGSLDNEQIVKTVKNFKDLPAFRKLSDGSKAPALEEWRGGLETDSSVDIITENGLGGQCLNFGSGYTADCDSQEPPRKRRRTQRTIKTSTLTAQCVSPDAQQLYKNKGACVRIAGTAHQEYLDDAESLTQVSDRKIIYNAIKRQKFATELANETSDIQSVSQPLPMKLRRKLQRTSNTSNLQDVDDSMKPAKKRGAVVGKVTEIKSALMDGRRRVPQNQLATEVLENLAKFPHCVLLTRVGNFYESYFDQAAEVAQLLSIKLTKRTWDRQEVLMCGFPIVHLDKYLKVLVQTHNRCVAMCEEFKRPAPEEGFDRRVVRVLTPGTLIDESFLNPYQDNYLLAVGTVGTLPRASQDDAFPNASTNLLNSDEYVGLAWIDVSTGEFFAEKSALQHLKDDLARIGPREVVLHASLKEQPSHPIRLAVSEEGSVVSFLSPEDVSHFRECNKPLPGHHTDDVVMSHSPPQGPQTMSIFTDHESSAISLLTSFLQLNLLEHMPTLSIPSRQEQHERMQIDSQTIKALEIRESIREGGVTGSLMSVVKRTTTSSGTRLLSRWLCSPSISVVEIQARQNLVALFCSRRNLRDDLTFSLKRIEDASRIVQRFLLGKGDVEDLYAIKNAIEIWKEIKGRVQMESRMDSEVTVNEAAEEWATLQILLNKMADLQDLAQRIEEAVTSKHENTPSTEDDSAPEALQREITADLPGGRESGSRKWTIKPEFSPDLLSLHARLKQAEAEKEKLEVELRRRYNAPSLTLRSSGSHGIHVHIANAKRDAADVEQSRNFISISSTGSTKSFFNQTWYLLGSRIIETILQISSLEKDVFETLRREVNAEAVALRRNARMIDELDVTLGFAHLATEMNFVRPKLNEGSAYSVTNGRHPSVELGLLMSGRVFTPNTVSLTPESRLHIITGPNMAGKSTLLRQTALLAILAQTGSFVPADKAEMGIVDKVFSRVGAKDDLFRDRSTFMVEMLETAEILKGATKNSLVIMDEVGRGTTVKDGLAIAFATICHLYNVSRCRTLFATHFHEVVDMLGYVDQKRSSELFKNIGFYCTDVDNTEDGYFTYSHRLRPGVNRDSHGLKVAQLAGMPPSVLRMANQTLDWMNARHGSWIANKKQLRVVGEAMATGNNKLLQQIREL